MSQQIESVKMALQELGINASGEFFYNPDYDLLIAHETSPELTGAARGVIGRRELRADRVLVERASCPARDGVGLLRAQHPPSNRLR